MALLASIAVVLAGVGILFHFLSPQPPSADKPTADGIKICEVMTTSANHLPGWRRPYLSPTESWITSLADGSFDFAAFERQLSHIIQSKAMTATNASIGGSDQKSTDLT